MPQSLAPSGSAPPVDPEDLVCVATSRDADRIDAWRAAMRENGVESRLQTVTARSRGREVEVVYLLYVAVEDEDTAARLLAGGLDGPIFPLAHLRHTDRTRFPV